MAYKIHALITSLFQLATFCSRVDRRFHEKEVVGGGFISSYF